HRAFLGNAQTPVSSNLSQSVVAPAAGKYLLLFDSIVEQNFTAASLVGTLASSGGPSATVDLLATKIPAGSSYTGGGFANIGAATPPYNIQQMLMISGVNAGDTLTVSVAMTNGIAGTANPQSAVVDNFRLTLIPEPSTAVLGGLGLIGLVIRRRAARSEV
ncbi:MAG TPA: PEP-CTERM sorting domain-containing protein, partial [Lacipirellula sp.]